MAGGELFPRAARLVLLLGMLAGAGAAPGWAADASAPDSAAIAAALHGPDPLAAAGHTLDKPALIALYEPRGFRPVWTEQREQSYRHALEDADAHGLDAASYAVATSKPVARELLLTDSFLRYAEALAHGLVPPQSFETDWRIDPPPFDGAKIFAAAVDGDVATVLAALAPHEPGYERLREALGRYTALAQKPWHSLSSPAPIQPGGHADIVPALRDRLIAEAYLEAAPPPDASQQAPDASQPVADASRPAADASQPAADASRPASDPTLYDPTLAAAVSRFQARHGLTVDGSVGRLTLAALNVSPALRVRQIRWNLERWRSLPRIDAPNRIEVNVAAAQATLYQDGVAVRVMKTIVGATIHPTPVLRARMQSVLFNPPWMVPSSIIENEIRPALKKDPKYLQRQNLVYQDVDGGKQLIQIPGPKNSLGQVKFEMPNPDDIYMHDTPEQRLFMLSRRFISHGCIRVEDPRELARILLDSDDWSREAIDAAIATGQTQSVPLHKTLPVYVLYWTAFVDPDGTIEFRDDAYGRDRRLADALGVRVAGDHVAATGAKAEVVSR